MRSALQEAPLSLDALLADSARADCGALTIFAGTVRNHHEGRAVARLVYTAHAALAAEVIRAVEQEVQRLFPAKLCRIVHRLGALEIGETAILIVVRTPHRAESFAAAQYAITQVKHRAPIWKEEFFPDGSSAFVQGCCLIDEAETSSPAHPHPHHLAHDHAHKHDATP